MRVFHQQAATRRFNAADAPGGVAEQHHIAANALDGKILVDRADRGPFRHGDDGVKRVVGNRSTAGDRGEAAAAPPAHSPVHAVAIEVRAIAAAARRDAFGKHFEDCVKIGARKAAIRISAAHQPEQVLLFPVLAGAHGDHLLRQHVERRLGDLKLVQAAVADGARERGALDQLVARHGKDAALGDGAAPVPGAPDALQRHRDGAGRSDLAHQVDRANVNTQLEGSRGHKRARLARFQLLFRRQPELARKAAVMRRHRFLA